MIVQPSRYGVDRSIIVLLQLYDTAGVAEPQKYKWLRPPTHCVLTLSRLSQGSTVSTVHV